MPQMTVRQQLGNDLAELLWDNGRVLRRTLFPPFAGSDASRPQEHHPAMRGLLAAPYDDDAVPWDISVDDGDGELPTEYSSALQSGIPATMASRDDAVGWTSHGAAVPPKQQPGPRPTGEGVVNFAFLFRPLQRPALPPSAAASIPVGAVCGPVQTNRLGSWPLKESRAAASPPSPISFRHREELPQRLQSSEARATERPPPSVGSEYKGERRQLKSGSGSDEAPEWWVSQSQEDEEHDFDEAGGARSRKRNMSHRRRRERINKKMRALQQLIPNCDKVDKASLLDEAIEYLKTLQLQVQMMSTMHMAAHLHVMGFGMGALDPRLVGQFRYPMFRGMPMFAQGPSPPPFPQQIIRRSNELCSCVHAGAPGMQQRKNSPNGMDCTL